MAAISNLILTFLILACGFFIQLISLIKYHQEMQEKQYQLTVQQTSQLSTMVQVQQDILKQLAAQQMSVLNEALSQLKTLVEIHREAQKQLMNITDVLQPPPPPPQDCSTAHKNGQFMIFPPNKALGAFKVYCDMDTIPGGWITFQRRFDGSINFDRNWVEYEDGFGSLAGEFWLGLKKLHILTSYRKWELRVDMEDFEGNHAYALHDKFKVGDSSSLYRLTIGSYSGTAGDSIRDVDSDANGMAFTTKDQDNDYWSEGNCGGDRRRSGWWHRHCTLANLNGLYLGQDGDSWTSMYWKMWKGKQSLKKSEMKIRHIDWYW